VLLRKKLSFSSAVLATCSGLVLTGIQVCVASCEEELRSFDVGERPIEASFKPDKDFSPDKEVVLMLSGASWTLRTLKARGR
jgi:hypothetical protein